MAATRTVVAPGDDRQGTYVGATRGRSDNVIMVITPSPKLADPLPLSRPAPELTRFRQIERERQGHQPRAPAQGDLDEGMAVLADVLARDATDLAATEYRARERSNADHLGLLHAIWMDLTERADAERFRPIVQSALAESWGITKAGLARPPRGGCTGRCAPPSWRARTRPEPCGRLSGPMTWPEPGTFRR